jgi:hypothetical protein
MMKISFSVLCMYVYDGQCTANLENHFSIVLVAFENGGFVAAHNRAQSWMLIEGL